MRLGKLVDKQEEEVSEGLVGSELEARLSSEEFVGHSEMVRDPRAFIISGGIWRQYRLTISGAWILSSGSHVLSDVGYPFHLIR